MIPLPAATRPGMVRLRVGDLERSLAWYRDLLGFTVLEESGARVQVGAAEPILELNERPGLRPAPKRAPSLYHFAVLLPDRASLGRVLAVLLEEGVHPGSADHLVSEALYLSDPDGLGIELYADRPRERWTARGGAIAMDTLPLDVRSLLAEGASSTWHGMPGGTRMGHIHLHVPDLAAAAAFHVEALGLEVMAKMPGALFLAAGGYHHHLGLNTWAPPGPPPEVDEAALLDWELVVPAYTEIRGRVVTPDAELRLEDPFGMVVRATARVSG